MKSTIKLFGSTVLTILIAFLMTGCGSKRSGPSSPRVPSLISISVNTEHAKLNYHQGDVFDYTGLEVTANYSDNSTKPVDNRELSFDYDFSNNGAKSVTANWKGKSAVISVTVDEYKLIKIDITPPVKEEYKDEDTLDLAGLEITAIYENRVESLLIDDKKEIINDHMLVFSKLDPTTPGKQKITVTYGGKPAYFDITMYALMGITAVPGKIIYVTGEHFDREALNVTADYNAGLGLDKHESIINKEELGITGFSSAKADSSVNVTITWKGKKTSFDVSVYIPSGIEIVDQPTKLKYSIGEKLDTSGLVVKAYYTDGIIPKIYDPNPVPIENLKISGFNSNIGGSQIVILTYGSHTTAYNVTIVVLNKIEIISQTKTNYRVGEKIDKNTFKVQAVYSDIPPEIVDSYTIDVGPYNTRGPKAITITYEGKSTTLNVTYDPLTVSFDPNKGNGSVSPINTDYNVTFSKPLDEPSRDYYEFADWYKEAECINRWNFGADKVTKDTTLYAKWNLLPFDENDEGSVLADYLDLDGGTIGNPFKLILNRDLGKMTISDSGWQKLLGAIATANKYVNLDLSGCTMSNGTTFDPVNSESTGKDKIVEITLPNAAIIIKEGNYVTGGFNYFTALESISGLSIESIEADAFSKCTSLERVEFFALKSIKSTAFNGTNLTLFKCHASTPPILGSSVFGMSHNDKLQIMVPKTSVNSYKTAIGAALGWQEYADQISSL